MMGDTADYLTCCEGRPMHRRLKWIGIATCLLLILLWVGSLFWVLRVPGGTWTVRLCYGSFDFFTPPTNPPGWRLSRFNASPPMLLPNWGSLRGGWFVVIPLWIPWVLVAIPTAWLWWRVRGFPLGHCPKCGYDLRGNVSGVCPECGQAVPVHDEATSTQEEGH